jgi:GxxExxY protein
MPEHLPIPAEIEKMAKVCVNSAYKVHTVLGPGLLESVYETCLAHELARTGLRVEKQVQLPVFYEGVRLDAGLRLDLLVEGNLIIELKAVEELLPVHQAQVMTYLKLTGNRLGLLINFNVPLIKNGIKRVVID